MKLLHRFSPLSAPGAASVTRDPMYRFLLVLTISSTMGLQAWRTLFDNFSVNVVGIDGNQMGVIQSFREVPGFLALLVVFVMICLKEHRVSALSVMTLGIGVAITGLFPSYLGLIGTTLVMSLGFHYYETTNQSLTLQYFDQKTSPLVLGKLRGMSAGANIAVGLVIFALTPFLPYVYLFGLLGGLVALAGVWGLMQKPTRDDLPVQHSKKIFRRKYWLYYLLTFLAGSRRQIFVAFSVFLMVKKFGFGVQEITILFILNNFVNYFLSPAIGWAIVRFDERRVLSLEYFALIFIFLGYALVDSKWLVALLYVADHIFFNFAVAIRTFFQKIGDPRDVAPSMAVGFTINHIGAVVFPVVGGLLWAVDYRIPFVAGAVLAVTSLVFVQMIPGQVQAANSRLSR
ncbi:MAG: MFS transporter [Thermoplasmata archaeon]|nr:MFS transporter [Thermoplasmata archaeon]